MSTRRQDPAAGRRQDPAAGRGQDPAATRLAGRIEPVVAAAGYDLEELVVTPAGRRSVVRVVVDRDEGVTLDDVAEVSRAVSAELDQDDGDFGAAPYVLEVTSPGVDRPLTEPRHWRRNTGRLVGVAVGPAGATEQVTGRVTAVDEDGVTLAVEKPGKPGARRKPPTPRQVPWAELGAGRVQVEFARPGRDDDPDDTGHGLDDEPLDDEHLDDEQLDDEGDDGGGQ
ncbi:ribosome maturation factor RimP [Geodermatophilus telluris]|uniref:Ribosome maturation factor RimP n=1 Tax=Geodermatophilus telluris TaxID=1190417 RepID=A0A1G6HUY7_9ACTN|nr:ribosome maturation factor RimP [Geodermatophilus telluris]SDB97963.1 ribosome maturation factor RimP [Geodermatophilus telluris]